MLRNDEGATLVEYSLVVALIAVAAIGAMTALGGNVSALFAKMSTDLQSA
jgi:pilus assembly protein Flp/PilA